MRRCEPVGHVREERLQRRFDLHLVIDRADLIDLFLTDLLDHVQSNTQRCRNVIGDRQRDRLAENSSAL